MTPDADARPSSSLKSVSQPADLNVSVAILYERLGHVMTRLDDLSVKLDRQETARGAAMGELERRVAEVESTLLRARWFMAGIAAAGGALGGGMASLVAQALG